MVSVSGDGGYNDVVYGVVAAGDTDAVCAVVAAGNANDHHRTTSDQPQAVATGQMHAASAGADHGRSMTPRSPVPAVPGYGEGPWATA